MSLMGILLLIMGIWLFIYIKITNLIVIRPPKKKYLFNKLAIIIKYQGNDIYLKKLLNSIKEQNIKLNYNIFIFTKESNSNLIDLANQYKYKIVVYKYFFEDIRMLNDKVDGFIILQDNISLNKNYFKDLKKDIIKGYDIVFVKNSYYFKRSVLFNYLFPYLVKEAELNYFIIYYNLKIINNKTLVYNYEKKNLKGIIKNWQERREVRKKYIPLLKKSLKYKLENHYERFKVCYMGYVYWLLFMGLIFLLGSFILKI